MKFKTSDNLIDLLVGQSLYSSPDVAVRELLQNAEDACYLQSLEDPSLEPQIVLNYSPAGNWVEIIDNGLGMDQAIFEDSFATIGASKTNSPRLQALLDKAGAGSRPIGQFGIGILSCFGVAECIEVRTKAQNEPPVSVRIRDRRASFEALDDHREERGTSLRLTLKPDGPMRAQDVPGAVARYVRHARHIWIANNDTGEKAVAPEQWLLEDWQPTAKVDSTFVDAGHLQLSEAWDNINLGLDVQIVLSNGEFLVEQSTSVLPHYSIGVRGEVNIKPGELTILMNREGFQQDERWQAFVAHIVAHYRSLVAEKLEAWRQLDFADVEIDKLRAIQRAVFLIVRTAAGEVAGEENKERARQLVPEILLLVGGQRTSVSALIAIAEQRPPLYYTRTDTSQQVQRSVSDRGKNLQFTETVQSLELRISLLRLNGFAVTRTERHDYAVPIGNRNQTVHVHDADVLSDYCSSHGIAAASVNDAPATHTQIGSSADAEAITSLFELPSALKIQSVDTMTSDIIADFNGYILNTRNAEIRRILEIMPSAVGNPIRKSLLSIYFALSTYRVSDARAAVFELITDPEFDQKASRSTGRFFRKFLEERVAALIARDDEFHE